MRRPRTPIVERVLIWIGIGACMLVVGWCSTALGTGRATQGDIRAVQTQVAERCR